MCTVTIIPGAEGAGYRMLCNRDEQRGRVSAIPPAVHRVEAREAVMPVDPAGGGTWVAVNGAGLGLTLLNLNLPTEQMPDRKGRVSRGGVIANCIGCESVAAAADRLEGLKPNLYMPFQLVVVGEEELVVLRSDGGDSEMTRVRRPDQPWMITSSGLGDHLVEQPRRELFDGWFERGADEWGQRQDAFHRHFWPDRTQLSVCMRRPDAKTVSLTSVSVDAGFATMGYVPGPPDRTEQNVKITIPIRREVPE